MAQETDVLVGSGSLHQTNTGFPTLAFFGGGMGAGMIYEKLQMWQGVAQAAQARGVNLLYVAGANIMQSPQAVLYELIDVHHLAGIISWNSFVTTSSTIEQVREFFGRYGPLPVINIELRIDGFSGIQIDNAQGVRDVLKHLVDVHGCHRIAYLGSRTGGPDSLRRLAYHEVMTGYGLDNPALDCFSLEELQKRLRPGADYQAVVTASDDAAIRVINMLRAQGVHVPGDVAVTGFNDGWMARMTDPPLTTVHLPFYEMGQRAVHLLLDQIAHPAPPEDVSMPLNLVIRRSCGCISSAVVRAAANITTDRMDLDDRGMAYRLADEWWAAQREPILDAVRQAIHHPVWAQDGHLGQLLDAFVAALSPISSTGSASESTLIPLLESLTAQIIESEGQVSDLQDAVSALRQYMLPLLDVSLRGQAEDLWQQARVLIGEITLRHQMYQTWQLEELSGQLNRVGQTLTAAGSMSHLLESLAQEMTNLGFRSGLLTLFDKAAPTSNVVESTPAGQCPEWSRLMLNWDHCAPDQWDAQGQRLLSRSVLALLRYPQDRPTQWLMQSLNLGADHLGVTVFELDVPHTIQEAMLHETLREQISNALRVVFLIEQQDHSRREAEAARRQLEVAVRDLQAAQRQYLEQRWSERVSSQAASGYVLAGDQSEPTGKEWLPVMDDVVQQAAVVMHGGDASETMLGIPMILAGELIGVLGGQGPRAWSREEIASAEAVMEQMALALESQRLLDEQQRMRALLDRRVSALNFLNDLGRRIEENTPMTDLLTWLAATMPSHMQHADLCRVAVRLGAQVYGAADAMDLPRQMTQGLRVGSELVGQVYVALTDWRDFADQDSALLGDVARRLSSYIESRRLLEATQANAQELAVLLDLGQSLTAQLDVNQALSHVYEGVSRLMDVSNFSIGLYEPEYQQIRFLLNVTESAVDRDIVVISGDQGLSGYIVRTGQSLLIDHDVGGWLQMHGIEVVGELAQSWLGVPLMVGDLVQGLMIVQNYHRPFSYDEHTRDMLITVASQVSAAIQNARLFEQTQKRVRQLAVLNEIGRVAAGQLDSESLLMTIYEQLGLVLNMDVFLVGSYDPDTGMVAFPIFYDGGQCYEPEPVALTPGTFFHTAIHSGKPVLVLRTAQELAESSPSSVSSLGDKTRKSAALMYAPMKIGDRIVGVMSVQSYQPGVYSREDLDLLVNIANQVTVALETARLFEQAEQRARREQILRQITTRVRGSMDPDTIVRTLARELGMALGRSAFVRLGSADELIRPPDILGDPGR